MNSSNYNIIPRFITFMVLPSLSGVNQGNQLVPRFTPSCVRHDCRAQPRSNPVRPLSYRSISGTPVTTSDFGMIYMQIMMWFLNALIVLLLLQLFIYLNMFQYTSMYVAIISIAISYLIYDSCKDYSKIIHAYHSQHYNHQSRFEYVLSL